MNRARLTQELHEDEGYELTVYLDSMQIETIGCGRNVDAKHGGGLRPIEVDYMLGNDIDDITIALDRAIPWWEQISDARQRAFVNMAMMGVSKFLGFKLMLAAAQQGNWVEAEAQARNSLWYRQVQATRSARVSTLLLQG